MTSSVQCNEPRSVQTRERKKVMMPGRSPDENEQDGTSSGQLVQPLNSCRQKHGKKLKMTKIDWKKLFVEQGVW